MRGWTLLLLLVAAVVGLGRPAVANFVAYDDDEEGKPAAEDEYLQDEEQRRADYHDAMDRMISKVLMNQTQVGNPSAQLGAESMSAKAAEEAEDAELKCAGKRKPQRIATVPQLTVKKCCPEGETFLHESIVKCKVPMRRSRLPVVSREVHLYDHSCYRFGHYLKPNISVDGKCIGKRLVFNDVALFTVIQNGSLMVSSPEQMAIFREFCLEETASSVLVAHVCDEIHFADPFDWVDKVVIGTALVALFITVLLYGFEKNFHTVFGVLVMTHVGLLFAALLLEAALTEFEEAFYSTIVFILIGASYVVFAAANFHHLISGQSGFQKFDSRSVAYVAFGCCLLWLISALCTLYYNEKLTTLCTIFVCLMLSVVVNASILRGIISRRHHLLTSRESCYDISDSTECSTYMYHRRELTILATFAATLQTLHWILYAAGRSNLLYGLSCCGLTVFAVFVCFRYRSITVLSCSRKALRHHHHQQQQQEEHHHHHRRHHQQQSHEEDSAPPPPEMGIPQLHRRDEEQGQRNQPWPPNPSSGAGSQRQWADNQKHTILSPLAEEEGRLRDGDAGMAPPADYANDCDDADDRWNRKWSAAANGLNRAAGGT